MTDRLKGVTVVFDRDIREDDAQSIIDAIRMLRHVADVIPSVNVMGDEMARIRVRNEIREKLWEALK